MFRAKPKIVFYSSTPRSRTKSRETSVVKPLKVITRSNLADMAWVCGCYPLLRNRGGGELLVRVVASDR
jgi:hypothetical protein